MRASKDSLDLYSGILKISNAIPIVSIYVVASIEFPRGCLDLYCLAKPSHWDRQWVHR